MQARDNPFKSECIDSLRYENEKFSMEALLSKLESLSYKGCLCGSHGFGKSTLLNEIGQSLIAKGYRVRKYFINHSTSSEERYTILNGINSSRDSECILLIDGADILSLSMWLRTKWIATRYYKGLVVTSHRRRLLPILYQCRTSPDLLAKLVQKLHPGHVISEQKLDHLYMNHGGNMRDIFADLYLEYSEQ